MSDEIQKTIPFPPDIHGEIVDLAEKEDRVFSRQVLALVKEALKQRQYAATAKQNEEHPF